MLSCFARYMGVPFKARGRAIDGADCWGLTTIVYDEMLNINLPTYVGDYTDYEDAESLIADQKFRWQPVQKPELYDLVLLQVTGIAAHVGVMLDDEHFLHTSIGHSSSAQRIKHVIWRDRVVGFFSYQH